MHYFKTNGLKISSILLLILALSSCGSSPKNTLPENLISTNIESVPCLDGKYCYVYRHTNEDGSRIADTLFNTAKFDKAFDFSNGVAIVANNVDGKLMYAIINTKGENLTGFVINDIQASKTIKDSHDFSFSKFKGRRLIVSSKNSATDKSPKWGVIDTLGKFVVPTIYDKVNYFSANLYEVRTAYDDSCGLVDITGKIVLPTNYKYIGYPKENRARISIRKPSSDSYSFDELYGYIDTLGKIIIAPQYEEAYRFADGIAAVCNVKNGDFIFINANGKQIINSKFSKAYMTILTDPLSSIATSLTDQSDNSSLKYLIHNKYIGAAKNGNWGVMDTLGNEVMPFKYNSITCDEKEMVPYNQMIVSKGNKFGVFDLVLKKEIVPCEYTQIIYKYPKKYECFVQEKITIVDSTGKKIETP